MTDKEKCEALAKAIDITQKHGPRSEELRNFLQPYAKQDDQEVIELMAIVIMLMENPDLIEKKGTYCPAPSDELDTDQ